MNFSLSKDHVYWLNYVARFAVKPIWFVPFQGGKYIIFSSTGIINLSYLYTFEAVLAFFLLKKQGSRAVDFIVRSEMCQSRNVCYLYPGDSASPYWGFTAFEIEQGGAPICCSISSPLGGRTYTSLFNGSLLVEMQVLCLSTTIGIRKSQLMWLLVLVSLSVLWEPHWRL